MCGVAGVVDLGLTGGASESVSSVVPWMLERLRHRGPDDQGIWTDPTCGVGIGNRRLAVVDLSKSGHQPMVDPGDRYVLSFNGEIYNHALLRDQLRSRGYPFIGRSDTEVLLAAIGEWGLTSTLARINGMFAFVVWDRL
ncbi:MAG TPA: asparagine synthetase B, partial [Acidimicrobiia bacterium]|nr:asparagine synthetase B [Acidimicrobiia bacterium]